MRFLCMALSLFSLVFVNAPLQGGMWKDVRGMFSSDHSEESATIRVLLEEEIDAAMLETRGGYNIVNPENGDRLGTRLFGKRFMVQAQPSGIKWGEAFPDTYQIRIDPDQGTSILLNGRQYSGSILVYQIGNQISIVNAVDVEDYVKSVLGPLFDKPLREEVMASVAIAARTEALYHIERSPNAFWHVSDIEVGYEGYGVTRRNNGVDVAVDNTRSFVMEHPNVDGDYRSFAARWTDHSAGKTAPSHVVFRKDLGGPSQGVEVLLSQMNREASRWTSTTSLQQIATQLGMSAVTSLDLVSDPVSHKVYMVRITTSAGVKDIDFLTFQRAIGREVLQSSEFTAQRLQDDRIEFAGFGRGHGVGVCLYAAGQMAERGADAKRILGTFFPGMRISTLDQEQTHTTSR